MNKFVVIPISLITLILLGLAIWIATGQPPPNPQLDGFAKCLADKKVAMYGAYWCPHCQAQKKLFGSAFQYIPYVECTVDIKSCTDKNITGYPTWIFADGSRATGEMSLKDLSSKTSCPLTSP